MRMLTGLTRAQASRMRRAINARLDADEPAWRQPTHVGRHVRAIVPTRSEVSIVKLGAEYAVVLTGRARRLAGQRADVDGSEVVIRTSDADTEAYSERWREATKEKAEAEPTREISAEERTR